MDAMVNVKDFRAFELCSVDSNLIQRISFLYVFARGNSAIFATEPDNFFGIGHNRSGCLALGHFKEDHRKAQPSLLSGKQVVDISAGFEHCIGLTSSGQCYSWGQNKYGQLGVGSDQANPAPQLISELTDLRVVQISSGAYFSMALTTDGDLYSWGHNTFAQLGDKTYNSRQLPTQVLISEPIASISCGMNNALALSKSGRAYVWGNNTLGQLGRDPKHDMRGREKPMCNRPSLVTGLDDVIITKGVCGPNHVLLLTSVGDIYAFGDNSCGQVGNGSTVTQLSPIKIRIDVKFKDIITHYDNDLSVAVTNDNKFFVWGSEQKLLKPQVVPDCGKSSYAVYIKYAINKVTYKVVKVNKDVDLKPSVKKVANEMMNNLSDQKVTTKETIKLQSNFISNRNSDPMNSYKNFNVVNDSESVITGHVSNAVETKSIAGRVFLRHLHQSFNNPKDFDMKITSDEKVIYCRKSVVAIRNPMFGAVLTSRLVAGTQIEVSSESFNTFEALLQYMYGIEPRIDLQIVSSLKKMAELFDEEELGNMCDQHIREVNKTIDETNVCALYKVAIKQEMLNLEKSCIEFAANNWKNICKSDEFQEMDDNLSKRLMVAVIKL